MSPSYSAPIAYFEDLTVGQRFLSRSVTVTQDEIIAFAAQFDPQPFHTDPVAAEHSIFKGLVASGWHTAVLTMRLFVTSDFNPANAIALTGQVPLSSSGCLSRNPDELAANVNWFHHELSLECEPDLDGEEQGTESRYQPADA